MPETSIIIRTYNEERHLPALLSAIAGQSYRDYEVIVVDSGSIDNTREIAAGAADQVIRISSHDFTFGYSLNIGIKASTGRFLVLVSAHTLPSHVDWLAALIEPLKDEKTAMVCGRQEGTAESKLSEFRDFNRIFGPKRMTMSAKKFFANNANSALRRDLWEQHMFDESLPGLEDIEWAKFWMERGLQVIYEPAAGIRHIHQETPHQVRRRYFREAVAARWIGVRKKSSAPVVAVSELAFALGDFAAALGSGLSLYREIASFRHNKAIGTIQGLFDGKVMENPNAKEIMFFDRSCKAVAIDGPGSASLIEVEIPEIKPGEVLIRVEYEGICGTDLEILDGNLSYYKNGMTDYPIVPGHELAGRIALVGQNAVSLKEGDRVVVECIQSCGSCKECRRSNFIGCEERLEMGVLGRDGGYAEYVIVPARYVHLIPPELDMQKATLCEPLAVILKGLNRLSRSWPPEPAKKRCMVVGAGSLGHLCALVLQLRGHDVTVFDRNPLRRRYFEGSQIKTTGDMDQLSDFDVLIEVTGDPEALDAILHRSPAGATILLLGLPYAHREFTFESIVAYDKTVVGSLGSSAVDFEQAIQVLPQIRLDPFLECILPFEKYREGWEIARNGKQLKVLLEMDKS